MASPCSNRLPEFWWNFWRSVDMNFTKFGKSGPNLQRLNFENFEKRRSGSRWFWVMDAKDNPPKISSRKNPYMPGSFCRTPCMHCSSHIQLNSEVQCLSSSVTSVTSSQCAWHVAHGQACLSGASHARLAPSWHRWRPGPPAPACLAVAVVP